MTTASPAPAASVPAPRPQITTGAQVAALVPQSLDEAFRVSQAIAASGLAPRGLEKAEQIMVAIMAGAELGFAPFQSLQSFAVVNGRPTLWGDGLVAVVRRNGCSIREWHEDETAHCEVTRPDTGETIIRSFSQADAVKAGLAGKTGPWQQYPQRMRAMRARAWAVRDGCADMLRGFQIAEEVQDFQPIRDVTPASTGMRARLEARNADRAQGFDADHVARETGATPAHDPETGEIADDASTAEFTDAPATAGPDDFPGDAPADLSGMKTGADLLAEQQAAGADVSPLNQRIRAFKAECEGKGTAELSKAWRRSSDLRNDIEAADPDTVESTNQELEAWFNGLFDAAETKEKGAA